MKKKKSKDMTIEEVKRIVHKADLKLKESDSGFMTAVILVSSLQVGPYVLKLEKFTGYDRSFIKERAKNFRSSSIWERGRVHVDWFEKFNSVSFWLDVTCGEGLLSRVVMED